MASRSPVKNAHLYIEKEDFKEKYYIEPQKGLKRIKTYCKSIQRIGGIEDISADKAEHGNTIKFTITVVTVSDMEAIDEAKKYIAGAFCKESAIGKHSERKSGTREAKKELSERDQRKLQSEAKQHLLTEENLRKHDIQQMQGPCELRQFGCKHCEQSWWRLVLKSKPVSRCRKCRKRYDPLPRNKEFGIGRYTCTKPSCGRKFFAKCEATESLMCRKCKTMVSNPYIHPRWKKAARVRSSLNPNARPFIPPRKGFGQPSQKPQDEKPRRTSKGPSHSQQQQPEESRRTSKGPSHSQQQQPEESRRTSKGPSHSQQQQPEEPRRTSKAPSHSQEPTETQQTDLPPHTTPNPDPPKPRRRGKRKKVFNASTLHESDGQTLSTFISQMSDMSDDGQSIDLDYDSDDEGVDACRFECDCGNKYTVFCELESDTAPCYNCGKEDNPALGWARGDLSMRGSESVHSCSKCKGRTPKSCPNYQRAKGHHH